MDSPWAEEPNKYPASQTPDLLNEEAVSVEESV